VRSAVVQWSAPATEYLDAAGLLLSAANRVLLRSSMPTRWQVLTWDRAFVPVSRVLDGLTGRRVGKSILAVWQETRGQEENLLTS
jgi:hypothetical protein